MKEVNLRDYYPFYTTDMIVEVPDEVADLLREYALLEEAYRIRTYRYRAFYSLDYDGNIERDIALAQPTRSSFIKGLPNCQKSSTDGFMHIIFLA